MIQMTSKKLIINSHYCKKITRPSECLFAVTEPGDVYGDNYYCGVIKGIDCGRSKFPDDCILEDWVNESVDKDECPHRYRCVYPGACGILLKTCWKTRPDCRFRQWID